ncbi:hypothetical protein J5A64_11730 [Prevotella denticola]|uniref:hypothetical protein n=1 Tax=Prevotella denticola TaxID=28129 RepID=UPI001BC86576|nr:hypothetical protein [Prevotella denticola]QUI93615.1 hypothetical protein J5A64_11730 [Prevotella denticola]
MIDLHNKWEVKDHHSTLEKKNALDLLSENHIDSLDSSAHYRFKQINVIRYEDIPISNSTIRAQYLFERANHNVHTKCEESYYTFTPQQNKIGDFLSLSDQIRKEVYWRIDKNGEPLRILNEGELKESWENAKKEVLPNNEFMNSLDKEQYKKIIQAGDSEFQDMSLFIRNYRTNLFFRELFGQYLMKSPENYEFEKLQTMSNFFKDIVIEADLTYSKLKEDENFIFIVKESELDRNKLDEIEMVKQYNKLYKPLLIRQNEK